MEINLLLCTNTILLITISSQATDVPREGDLVISHTNDPSDVKNYDTMCTKDNYRTLATGVPNRVFRGLSRIIPTKAGERRMMIIDGKQYTIITRALQPPIYEIPDYLTNIECEALIRLAKLAGLKQSMTLADRDKGLKSGAKSNSKQDKREIPRVSQQAWLDVKRHPVGTLPNMRERLIKLTGLPRHIIENSESLQVANYEPGGHYHAHLDSSNYDSPRYQHLSRRQFDNMPCCHQSPQCKHGQGTCCRLCRYLTVMYYLNDVEEGGQTAFVKACSNCTNKRNKKIAINLSYNCSDANLLLTPRKGTAVLWYNHFIDPQTGWLGKTDSMTLHGGCDVIKGEKWIGNNWINVPKFLDRYRESSYNRIKVKICSVLIFIHYRHLEVTSL